jgi:calcium-translocating P-type ATPase
VVFDPALTDLGTLLAHLARATPLHARAGPSARGGTHRVSLVVRGIDRDPGLARRVVERLESRPGVRATAHPLIGRVAIEFDPALVSLQDLSADVAALERPALAGEGTTPHPLAPAALVQGATRAAATTLGLAILALRRAAGRAGPPVTSLGPQRVALVIGALEALPALRRVVRVLLGAKGGMVLGLTAAVSLTLAAAPIPLAAGAAAGASAVGEARARRSAWRRYERRLDILGERAYPGAAVRLDAGARAPLSATVVEGAGTAIGPDGLPRAVRPGARLDAGARVHGGPLMVSLEEEPPFRPAARPAAPRPSLDERYLDTAQALSLAAAALVALRTRSPWLALTGLVLLSPRAAVAGRDAADARATERGARGGAIPVGTRPNRVLRRPDLLVLESPRLLAEGLEVSRTLSLDDSLPEPALLSLAAGIAAAAGSPWGPAFPLRREQASEGSFDGRVAAASVGGRRYSLAQAGRRDFPEPEPAAWAREELVLAVRRERRGPPLGLVALRPRLAEGVDELLSTCRRRGVELVVLSAGDAAAARALSRRARVSMLDAPDLVAFVQERQRAGARVALASDSASSGPGFAACDLAIGITSGRSSGFFARADVLAADLGVLAGLVETTARHDVAVRDATLLSVLGNVSGLAWTRRAGPAPGRALLPVHLATLGALLAAWCRLRGGERPIAARARLADPRPERWGRQSRRRVLRALESRERGLSSEEAAARRRALPSRADRRGLVAAVGEQLRSPLTAVLGAGALMSLLLGDVADVAIILAVILTGALVGAWQERRADEAARALESLTRAQARVLRDERPATVPAREVVPGDIVLLAPGDRVAADLRLLSARSLEVDEAALTGESFPVSKSPDDPLDAARVVLEGTAVTAGSGRGVVVAVGEDTRLGATAAATLDIDEPLSPLGARLNRLLREFLPLVAAGGAVVTGAGLLWRAQPRQQLAIGASAALGGVPEGLPLLTRVGEAAAARRLAERRALVRRLWAIEALGRVDVACADKTGTLTEGRLAVGLVADLSRSARPLPSLPAALRRVLLAAALASPHPDAPGASSHPTDRAVLEAARRAGLGDEMRAERGAESPFDPGRGLHAAISGGRLFAKGATEVLLPRCRAMRSREGERALDEAGRRTLTARAERLAARGLRVLMVAEGTPEAGVEDPTGLVAVGFLGISDPLRPTVPEAVRRCREAGVRVVMLTGDHPATARAIAAEAGLLDSGEVLTGTEVAELDDAELDRRLARSTIVARVTPLDKLRIVESLKRQGHAVAMTGDGVNDAPALRLADVGVAMGRGGTEVARQTADLVLADDDFSTLVEALVEGRSFWRNTRRALGLLLGGNLGEIALLAGAVMLGRPAPLTVRQILMVNLVTDVLPALAIVSQRPEHRNLARLARERTAALGPTLRADILRRGIATSVPALGAYLVMVRAGDLARARSVAFAGVVANQLAQLVDAGRAEGGLTRGVVATVLASGGMVTAAVTLRPLQRLLGLAAPGALGWGLIGVGALCAVLLAGVGADAPGTR